MKLSIFTAALCGAVLPLGAGVVFTIDPTVATATHAESYAGNATLFISATGTANPNVPS